MSSHPVFKPQSVAIITGGASGIGLAFAKVCHNYGMRIALVDLALSDLETEVSIIASSGSQHSADHKIDSDLQTTTSDAIRCYPMDVSSCEAWADLRARVEMDFGLPSVIFLNAGIASNSGWDEVRNFEKIMQTNYFGVVNGVATFLPSLRQQDPIPTAIIITGSKQGITNPPGNPAYNASKAAVKSFAESLSFDLRGTSTDVFLLVPGWTFTGLTRAMLPATARDKKPEGAWWPEQCIEFLQKKMEQGEKGFYAVCPDNDVTEEMDKKRMHWSAGDAIEGRPPLSRWREGWADEVKAFMEKPL